MINFLRGSKIIIGSFSIMIMSATLPTIFIQAKDKIIKIDKEKNKSQLKMDRDFGKMPLYFIENRGQINKKVSYYVQGKGTQVYFTGKGLTYVLTEEKSEKKKNVREENIENRTERCVLKQDFVGAKKDVCPMGKEKTEAVISYFKGPKESWKTGLKTYNKVVYTDLWPGIDLVYSGNVNQLKYEFVVKPGADPTKIQLAYEGARKVSMTKEGKLSIDTAIKTIEDEKPYTYQEINGKKVEVTSSYELNETKKQDKQAYGFRVGEYDKSKPLVIDPITLIYCGYIGGNLSDVGNGIAVDSTGAAYVVGTTSSAAATFPETTGSFDETNGGGGDAFVVKVNSGGTALIYCGYIGGSGSDSGNGIAVDSSGNAYIVGTTGSDETESFPLISGPDLTYNGEAFDAFVAKVNSAGTALTYCGYIGSDERDFGNGIAVDSSGDAYVTGTINATPTISPVTVGPDLIFNGGTSDAFVAKVNSGGTALTYCGYIGGSGTDVGNGIAIDSSGNAYVTGNTSSTAATFPVTVGPDLTHNTGTDAFVAKVNSGGATLAYCGYIGGSGTDNGNGIAVDSSGNAYVVGTTASTEATFPVTGGPDLTHNTGNDIFVAKVKATPTFVTLPTDGLSYCGYIGGSGTDTGNGIAIDSSENAYVVGTTTSSDFSTTGAGWSNSTTLTGSNDIFIAKVNSSSSSLTYSGYLGGTGNPDAGLAIAVSGFSAYVTGSTISSSANSFPVTVGPDLTYNSNTDCFVARLSGVVTAAEIDNIRAEKYEKGTLIEWQTGYEADNLGFNIYREKSGRREKLTTEVIAGSALKSADRALGSGDLYTWVDTNSEKDSIYWIESVDINGTTSFNGPIIPRSIVGSIPKTKQAALLSSIGRGKVTVESPLELSSNFLPLTSSDWRFANQEALKISIKEQGWYRIPFKDIQAVGFTKIDPRNLQLFTEGREQPILLTGEKRRLNSGDGIEFYGTGLNSLTSDTQTYWLIAGSQAGKRIGVISNRKAARTFKSFPYTIERKERGVYFASLLNGDEDNFFGSVINVKPVDEMLSLPEVDTKTEKESILEIGLQGVTNGVHSIDVELNHISVGNISFKDKEHKVSTLTVPSSLLLNGNNTITLTRQGETIDVSLVDYVRVKYFHLPTVDKDTIQFETTAESVTLDGFKSSLIRTIDLTNEVELQSSITKQPSGYAVTVGGMPAKTKTLFAFTSDQIKSPAAINLNQPSKWNNVENQADIVMITHGDFIENVKALKELREKEGYKVAVVNIEDIYDEFSYGEKTPEAIKAFLSRAREWKVAPRFVLLVGDGHYDPRDYLGSGSKDYIPVKMMGATYLESQSDDWYTDFDGDDVPELAIGRLPVSSKEEAAQMVNKIIRYEQSQANQKVLLVSDKNDGYEFEKASENIKKIVSSEVKLEKVKRSQMNDLAAKQEVVDKVNEGPKIVNYYGHGTISYWRGGLLSSEDVGKLSNKDNLSIFLMMTCMGGYSSPIVESIGKSLMKAKGGGVAVWASTGMTEPEGQVKMNEELYHQMFGVDKVTLGEAVIRAKKASSGDVRKTWILMGDPSMTVK